MQCRLLKVMRPAHCFACWAHAVLLLTALPYPSGAQQRRTLRSDQPLQPDPDDLTNHTGPIQAVTVDVKLKAPANSSNLQDRSQYFAICASAKDQHEDIAEWLEYHEQLGAGKIYVYDDGSDPPMLEPLVDFIKSGLVEYHFIGKSNQSTVLKPQLYVYDQCINRYKGNHQFIAFIDIDEFLFLRDPNISSMPQLLQDYESYGALAVNWVQFGSSGHLYRPRGSTMASYWKCIPRQHPENLHVKTIANTKYVEAALGPHHFTFSEGKKAVNENFELVDGPRSDSNEISRIALYHYVTKSREQYLTKMGRGSAMKNFKTIEFFDLTDSRATSDCKDAVEWMQSRGQQHQL